MKFCVDLYVQQQQQKVDSVGGNGSTAIERCTLAFSKMASKNNGKIGVDWKRKVRSKYHQIRKQKQHKRADEAKMAWNQNR